MSAPKVTSVAGTSPATRAGLQPGDEILSLNGRSPRDVIEYQQLVDDEQVDLRVRRPGPATSAGGDASGPPAAHEVEVSIRKEAGRPLGITVESAVFDRVRTCDNHCAFCFIHQLPKGMRRSLYLKDDDYRLSFLYGNFTTLTRFTELDAERVLEERLGPLFVSIHATDPHVRAHMLRNPKGATSLRWLEVLLEGEIEVHGQIVVCPGVNDGDVLADTFTTILDRYPRLATLGVVPLGISKFSREPEMRAHTREEAAAVCDEVEAWQATYRSVLGRRLVFAADEYYLLADRPFPPASAYEGFPQHENGIGIARAFVQAFEGDTSVPGGVRPGFFAWVEGAPAAGYRAVRTGVDAAAPARGDHHRPPGAGRGGTGPGARPRGIGGSASPAGGGVGVITGSYGAMVLRPLLAGVPGVRLVEVPNTFFGGNIGVAGLLTGEDVGRALHAQPAGDRYLLPDACLSEGRFLDGQTLDDLPQPVEVVPAEGDALRVALGVGT